MVTVTLLTKSCYHDKIEKTEKKGIEMEEQISAMKKARRKYEKVHKEERKAATGQFNTRLPREDLEEINAFLKENKISKIALIHAGYALLRSEVEKAKEEQEQRKQEGRK